MGRSWQIFAKIHQSFGSWAVSARLTPPWPPRSLQKGSNISVRRPRRAFRALAGAISNAILGPPWPNSCEIPSEPSSSQAPGHQGRSSHSGPGTRVGHVPGGGAAVPRRRRRRSAAPRRGSRACQISSDLVDRNLPIEGSRAARGVAPAPLPAGAPRAPGASLAASGSKKMR